MSIQLTRVGHNNNYYRVKYVVNAMLKAGISLKMIDSFRDLLEDHGYSLTSSSNLRQLLPFILQEEMTRLKTEIDGEPVSVVFDGTTHVGVLLRFICSDWLMVVHIGIQLQNLGSDK